jgi:hypothetical protein
MDYKQIEQILKDFLKNIKISPTRKQNKLIKLGSELDLETLGRKVNDECKKLGIKEYKLSGSEDRDCEIELEYYVDVDKTPSEIEAERKRRFNNSYFYNLNMKLIQLGYVRINTIYSRDFKKFENTTVYDLLIDEDSQRLIEYISLRFKKRK